MAKKNKKHYGILTFTTLFSGFSSQKEALKAIKTKIQFKGRKYLQVIRLADICKEEHDGR